MNLKEVYESSRVRVLTSLALMGSVISMVLINNLLVTWAILGIAYIFAFHEAMKLFGSKDNKFYVYAVIIWALALFYPNPVDIVFVVLIIIIGYMAHVKKVNFKILAPFIYPTFSMLFMLTLYKDFGVGTFFWLIMVVSGTDTGAYFTGKYFGKTSFSPTSPNKTWEGVLGGIVFATIIGTLMGATLANQTLLVACGVSFIVATSSVWGDLFESYLKREAGVKDSGNIFPGHGGFLDRLDGYLFGGIIMVVLLRALV